MGKCLSNFFKTIIIHTEIHTIERGYSLLKREFVLKEPLPRITKVTTLDGQVIENEYWVISINEYMRVVPEARSFNFGGDEIFIPTFVASPSFKPKYLIT
jgi:hypothetical protein